MHLGCKHGTSMAFCDVTTEVWVKGSVENSMFIFTPYHYYFQQALSKINQKFASSFNFSMKLFESSFAIKHAKFNFCVFGTVLQ